MEALLKQALIKDETHHDVLTHVMPQTLHCCGALQHPQPLPDCLRCLPALDFLVLFEPQSTGHRQWRCSASSLASEAVATPLPPYDACSEVVSFMLIICVLSLSKYMV